MNEIKTLNGYHLADETAREGVERLTEEIDNLKENGGGGSGLPEGGAPNQFLVTDAGGMAKWEDRYGYKRRERKTVFGEQDVVFNDEYGIGMLIGFVECDEEIDATTGMTITFDGTSYEVKQNDGAFGNLSLFGEGDDTGEPFAGSIETNGIILCVTDGSTHRVEIVATCLTIVKMPIELLETKNPYIVVNIVADGEGGYKSDISSGEILMAVENNQMVYASIPGIVNEGTPGLLPYVGKNGGTPIFAGVVSDNAFPYLREFKVTGTTAILTANTLTEISPRVLRLKRTGGNGSLRMQSNTAGSNKWFKITVDDNGTLTATEITE